MISNSSGIQVWSVAPRDETCCRAQLQDMQKKKKKHISLSFCQFSSCPHTHESLTFLSHQGQNSNILLLAPDRTLQKGLFWYKDIKTRANGEKTVVQPSLQGISRKPFEPFQSSPHCVYILSDMVHSTTNVLEASLLPGHAARYSSTVTDFST